MILRRYRALGWVILLTAVAVAAAQAGPGYGQLSGVVVDPSGTPQMGAAVWVEAEGSSGPTAFQLLTNERGLFSRDRLRPGYYSLRVTLAGFLPAIERHFRISPNLTTLLKIELDSVFASVDRLRRQPQQSAKPDEWKWVLRTSAATRPVLQWADGEVFAGGAAHSAETRQRRPRGQVEITSGSRTPGSNLASLPATSFAYDQKIGNLSSLLLAGQVRYEGSAAESLAAVWLPSGELGVGPKTTVVVRKSKLAPQGPTIRGMYVGQTGQLALGDRFLLDYGGEYILVGLGPTTSSLRPRAQLDVRASPNWRASMLVAPWPAAPNQPNPTALQSVLATLDGFHALLWRNGRPVLEGGWHEEIAVERELGAHASLQAAVFRDRGRHVAVFGRGSTSNPEFFPDFFSEGFTYDGGGLNSWGTRVTYRQKFSDDLDLTAVYAWAGALMVEELASNVDLRDALATRYRHSVAARVSGRLPRLGTRLAASYKWVNGPVVSRQDIFGEAIYQLEPNLTLSVRQPLPNVPFSRRWEALADFGNLLAQGYVPVNGRDGQLILVPAFRSFRGGVSFQF